MLNPKQFPDQPYPRIREAYARHWAIDFANLINDEAHNEPTGELPAHPRESLEAGRIQAMMMVNTHLVDRTHPAAKNLLINKGFKNRKETRKQYASWYN